MDEQYKLEHEKFVQNNNGTTFFETCSLLTILPVSILFQRVVFSCFLNSEKIPLPLGLRFILELMFIILPFIVSVTYTQLTLFLIIGMLITCLTVPLFAHKNIKIYFKNPKELLQDLNSSRKSFLEEYRSFIMLATCVCILAVDFKIFPRRFGKTETYGISLMDIGVGSVVLSGALVSRQARYHFIKKQQHDREKDKQAASGSGSGGKIELSRGALVWHQLVAQAPLMVLGFVRMLLTKSTNYQEHVSEYGVHWNFFFTLGFVAIFLAFMNFSPNVNGALGVLIIVGYQMLLQSGLSDYILHHPRDSLLAANKEGICSIAGYLAIYLIGIKLGDSLFKTRNTIRDWLKYSLRLLATSVLFYVLWYLCEIYIDKTSRRMANLGYVLAILSLNLFNFSINILISILTGHQNSSVIAKSVNRNQLFIFLLGNILTGLTNFSMKTIYATEETAMIVICSYTFILSLVALLLDYKNITIKFWAK
ncbi:hypothetical protein CYY_000059 [Polysphondylium violaceum]|uniref:Phosphatidylinositol-glycan biosynthesis class W protein n=1 Tax=Polysphondylium violaceum TaxID=133409 RepID=A0A8J4V619_9MYCE|nr:hypothetical protein CYY_000059 [Polysphondylium violaceum]